METTNNELFELNNAPSNWMKMMEISRLLGFETSVLFKNELIDRNIMWKNEKEGRFEFTQEAIKRRYGKEHMVKKNYSYNPKPCNLYNFGMIEAILKTDYKLPPHFGELQGMVDYLF